MRDGMKTSKWYDISCVLIVVISLGYLTSLAYFLLWDKYKAAKLKKWAIFYVFDYLILLIWFVIAIANWSSTWILLWIIATVISLILSLIQIIYLIIMLNKTTDRFESVNTIQREIESLARQTSQNNNSVERSFGREVNNKLDQLVLENAKLVKENSKLLSELNQLKNLESHSRTPNRRDEDSASLKRLLMQEERAKANLEREKAELLQKYSDLNKRYENLQDSIIDRHDKRNERLHQREEESERMMDAKLNEESILKEMGYQITGTSRDGRWRILEQAVKKHGLRQVIKTIDGNIALRVRQTGGRKKYAYAIAEWNHDLDRLKRTYYKGDFVWPPKR